MAINYSLTKDPFLRQFPENRAHLNIVLEQCKRVPRDKDITGGELAVAILSKTEQVHVVTGLDTAGAALYEVGVAWTRRVYRITVPCPPEGGKDPKKLIPVEIRVLPQPWNPAASASPASSVSTAPSGPSGPNQDLVASFYQEQMVEEGYYEVPENPYGVAIPAPENPYGVWQPRQ
jgi:hypothetical protein